MPRSSQMELKRKQRRKRICIANLLYFEVYPQGFRRRAQYGLWCIPLTSRIDTRLGMTLGRWVLFPKQIRARSQSPLIFSENWDLARRFPTRLSVGNFFWQSPFGGSGRYTRVINHGLSSTNPEVTGIMASMIPVGPQLRRSATR